MRHFIISALIMAALWSCQGGTSKDAGTDSGTPSFKVAEVIQTNHYTYIKTTDKKEEQWFAIPRAEVETGKTYYYQGGYEMFNFEGKEAGKTFEKITFLDGISQTPIQNNTEPMLTSPHGDMSSAQGNRPVFDKMELNIEPAEGGMTISQLYEKMDQFEGKRVKVRGTITKINEAIMDRNWIHIQDGSEFNGKFDLTATSQEIAKKGDTVVVEGKVALKKDFGYGYYYELLLEDSKITIE